MTNYKEVFELAQSKGYVFYTLNKKELLVMKDTEYQSLLLLIELTLIQKYLKDEHNIHFVVDRISEKEYSFTGYDHRYKTKEIHTEGFQDTYEQVLMEGINEGLKLIP